MSNNNGGDDIIVRRLANRVLSGNLQMTGNTGLSIRCEHVTSITSPPTLEGLNLDDTNCLSSEL